MRGKYSRSLLILNDIHVPFERSDVRDIVRKHSKKITHLVIGGDFMDCYSISSFPKTEKLSLTEELVYAHNFLKEIRSILGPDIPIIMIKGNHEDRHEVNICKMQEKNYQELLNPEILEMLVDGFEIYHGDLAGKYEGVPNVQYIPAWYVNIDNKVIVCHPKNFSIVKGTIMEKSVQHFNNIGEVFDVVVVAHTHKFSTGIIERHGAKYAVENGCLCKNHAYSNKGKLNMTPQHYCYTLINYDIRRKIDRNNIRTYHLEEEDIAFRSKSKLSTK